MARSPDADSDYASDVPSSKLKSNSKANGKQPARINSRSASAANMNGDHQSSRGTPLSPTQRVNEEDDEQDGSEGHDSEDESPNGRKRIRLSENGDGEAVAVKDEPVKKHAAQLIRNDDGYVTGSIVRAKLHNFMTYDDAEFRPGPYLNMVLGPNGTGKSSIAAALCLGLGFNASTMGRQELKGYVKHGQKEAFVEVELKGRPGQRNVTVRRKLSSTSKGSTFELNGKPAKHEQIKNEMKKFNISIDNLCSFLPQDKVAEFARMSPQELLKETEKSAGDSRLVTWHETLTTAGKELKKLKDELATAKGELDTLIHQNERDKHEVDAYRRRKEQEKLLQIYTLYHHYKLYHETRVEWARAKRMADEKKNLAEELKARDAPLHNFHSKLQKAEREGKRSRDDQKEKLRSITSDMKRCERESERLDSATEDKQQELVNIKKNANVRQAKMTNLRDRIAVLELKLNDVPESIDPEAIKEEKRQYSTPIADIKGEIDVLERKHRDKQAEYSQAGARIDGFQRELTSLQNQSNRRLADLRKWDADCADAIEWLRKNKNRFREEVFEPAVVSLSVPDRHYTNAVESLFNANQIKTFVCKCEEDYKTLTQLVNDTGEALGRKGRINVWYRPQSQLQQDPLSPEQLQRFGFQGYAIDRVECPDGLKWFLKKELNFHRNFIKLDERVDEEQIGAALKANNQNGATYVAGMAIYRATRSLYGAREVQTSRSGFKPARNLIIAPPNQTAINQASSNISQQRQLQQELNDECDRLKKEADDLEDQKKKHQQQLDRVENKVTKLRNALKLYEKAKTEFGNNTNKLAELEAEPAVEERIRELKKDILETAMKRLKCVRDYKAFALRCLEAQRLFAEQGFQDLQLKANISEIEKLKAVHADDFDKAEAEALQFAQKRKDLKARYGEEHDVVQEKLAECESPPDDIGEIVDKDDKIISKFAQDGIEPVPQENNSQHFRDLMNNTAAEINANLARNAGVIERYERREQEIRRQNDLYDKKQANCNRKEKEMKVAKDEWHPALKTLVTSINAKFSLAFDRIGCVGEVRIGEHLEDYDKWAIEILVKFRDDEPLQLLDGQRQSGGERALTTILYLMSLTELARSPFSLVDEINQGMDQRAEREVHNQLVEVACAEESGQYFLITPKLLPALRYHERMKILCVNNGEWLDYEEPGLRQGQAGSGSMMKMIKDTIARRQAVAA